MIDYGAAEPPWRQLAAILRVKIESGEITGRLPGEKALMRVRAGARHRAEVDQGATR